MLHILSSIIQDKSQKPSGLLQRLIKTNVILKRFVNLEYYLAPEWVSYTAKNVTIDGSAFRTTVKTLHQ